MATVYVNYNHIYNIEGINSLLKKAAVQARAIIAVALLTISTHININIECFIMMIMSVVTLIASIVLPTEKILRKITNVESAVVWPKSVREKLRIEKKRKAYAAVPTKEEKVELEFKDLKEETDDIIKRMRKEVITFVGACSQGVTLFLVCNEAGELLHKLSVHH